MKSIKHESTYKILEALERDPEYVRPGVGRFYFRITNKSSSIREIVYFEEEDLDKLNAMLKTLKDDVISLKD